MQSLVILPILPRVIAIEQKKHGNTCLEHVQMFKPHVQKGIQNNYWHHLTSSSILYSNRIPLSGSISIPLKHSKQRFWPFRKSDMNLTDTSRGSSHFGRKFDHMNHIPIFGDLEEPFFYVNFDIFSGQKKQTKIYRFLFYHFSPKPLKVTGMQNAAWPGLGSNLGATLFSWCWHFSL